MELNPDGLMAYKVTELRAELRKRGLPSKGLKQVLVGRLRDFLLQQQEQNATAEEEEELEEVQQQPEEQTQPPPEEIVVPPEIVDAPAPAPEPEVPGPEVQKEESVPARGVEVRKEEDVPATEVMKDAPEPEAMDMSHDEPHPPIEQKIAVETPSEPVAATSPSPPVSEPSPNAEMEHALAPGPEAAESVLEPVTEQAPSEPAPHAASKTAPKAVPEPVLEPVATEPVWEPVPVPAPEPVSEEPAAESTRVEISTAEPMDTTPIETSTENATVPPSAPSTLDPPETVSIQAMNVDPVDSLKRKRRSGTPLHPASVEPTAEDDITPPSLKKQRAESPPRRGRDARFKGLFNDSAPAADLELEGDNQDEAPVEPSIHTVTRALYIRNFVRPLQEQNLRNHVLSLASRNDEEPAQTLIESFYLDSIKSHALIVFDTPASANRVRVGIHNKVFPPEKTRKPLWADFVPEENVAEWVQREKARGMGGRWEVLYDTVHGEVTAELVEGGTAGGRLAGRISNVGVAASAAASAARKRSIDISNAPSGPRRTSECMFPSTGGVEELMMLTVAKLAQVPTCLHPWTAVPGDQGRNGPRL